MKNQKRIPKKEKGVKQLRFKNLQPNIDKVYLKNLLERSIYKIEISKPNRTAIVTFKRKKRKSKKKSKKSKKKSKKSKKKFKRSKKKNKK